MTSRGASWQHVTREDENSIRHGKLNFPEIAITSGTGVEHGTKGTSEEGERLLEVLVHGSLNASTKKDYSSKWGTWTTERARANLGP